MTFSYWGSKKSGEELNWSQSWEESLDAYPQMVQMRFAGSGENPVEKTAFVKLLIDPARVRR